MCVGANMESSARPPCHVVSGCWGRGGSPLGLPWGKATGSRRVGVGGHQGEMGSICGVYKLRRADAAVRGR